VSEWLLLLRLLVLLLVLVLLVLVLLVLLLWLLVAGLCWCCRARQQLPVCGLQR
jgi:hypothetical protein